ncbi:MAG: UDP-N-acetylmuramoyl-tripeptide--D-alanyl-D-alanine ligase [Nitrospirae bacterium]|nr:UDP-N-acetylmuramoyl-tripeptide--D-alanyl-D-alanine ligase [Candidatus Manganitrophaceae bacterium]
MKMWTIETILSGSEGILKGGALSSEIAGFSIDTRTIRPGELFIALKGPRFDGHDFIAPAMARGAAGAMVSRAAFEARNKEWQAYLDRAGFVLVHDPLEALQAMATWHRNRFQVPLIGVTGSNGKTTTKEMIAAILSRRGAVLKNEGNLNNHIGLPLSVLRLNADHRAAVLEIGISQKGEMQRLCEIARPTVGVITNIGPAHLEFLGSLAGVAEEKGKLFESVGAEGTAVINLDDPHLASWEGRASNRTTFSLEHPADVTGADLRQAGSGIGFTLRIARTGEEGEILLATSGRHQAYNALAAAAVASSLGYRLDEIGAGLGAFRPVALRAELLEVNGKTILLDAYNANPASMKAALEMLGTFVAPKRGAPRKVAILGDMLELGAHSERAHREIGRYAAAKGVDLLLTVGQWAEQVAEGARHAGLSADAVHAYADLLSLEKGLIPQLREGDVLLIKGSRGMRMEALLPSLGVQRAEKGHN